MEILPEYPGTEIIKVDPYNRQPRLHLNQIKRQAALACEALGWRLVDLMSDCTSTTIVLSDRGYGVDGKRFCTHELYSEDFKKPFLASGNYDMTLYEAIIDMDERAWR